MDININMNTSSSLSYQNNSFDLLRYYAAFAVMLLHYTGYFAMLSAQESSFLSGIRTFVLSFPGVIVLFTLSGFLISSSFERSDSRKLFLKKRILRLFPELWICTLFNLLLLSFLTGDAFDSSIAVWLFTQIFGIAHTPSCLKGFATGSVNGALWTIFVELQLYLVTLLFYPFLKKLSHAGWLLLFGLSAGINLLLGYCSPALSATFLKLAERTFFPYVLWFLIGMFCYINRNTLLPFLKKLCPYLILFYALLFFLIPEQPGYYCGIITGILCPLITISLSYRLPAVRIKTDLSYGMFLYHWIVLNILVHFHLIEQLSWLLSLLLFLAGTLLLSMGSHALSVKALKMFRKRKSNSCELPLCDRQLRNED